jgi:hypothetical protein
MLGIYDDRIQTEQQLAASLRQVGGAGGRCSIGLCCI